MSQKLPNLTNKTRNELLELANKTKTLVNKRKYKYLDFIFPETGTYSRHAYPKALEFFKAGATHRFRVLAGANGVGKSFDGAAELVYHATGLYPEWWEGLRLKNPKLIWIVTESPDSFKSSLQKLLIGDSVNEEDLGTGLIPKECLLNTLAWGGVSGAIRTIEVRHKNGHIVTIEVKSFEQEGAKLESANVDFALFDEEPPIHVYTPVLFRLRGSPTRPPGGAIMLFTSLKGLTEVVLAYAPDAVWPNGECPHDPDKYVVRIEMEEVPHLSQADRDMYLKNCPPNQLASRTKGLIQIGSGKIYPYSEEQVFVTPFEIPDYWPRAFVLDFGHHVTCALWGAKDPQRHILYIYAEYYCEEHRTAQIHALNIIERGRWIKGISDPSGGGRQDDGRQLVELFRASGLDLTPGDNSAVGITRNQNMFENGSLKIFDTCQKTKQEYRLYRWDTKNPNEPARNQKDHAMDGIKYITSIFDYVATTEYDAESSNSTYDRPRTGYDKLTGYG